MNHALPSACLNNELISIRFLDFAVSESVEVACVVDQTDFSEVIGVEILGLRRQLSGGLVEGPSVSGSVRWSYDAEIDAFYVHVMEGHSQAQIPVKGQIGLDSARRVVLLEVPVPPAAR